MPISEIVSHAVDQAIALARDPDAERKPSLEVFKPTLIVRDSTAPRRPPTTCGQGLRSAGTHTRIAPAPGWPRRK